MVRPRLLPSVFFALALAGCGKAPPAAEAQPPARVDASGRLLLSPAQEARLGIRSAAAQTAATIPVGGLAATVVLPMTSSAQVTMPYAGVVTRMLVDEGEHVRRGQPLLRVQSRELLAAQADRGRAAAEAGLADAQARRDALLEREGLIPAARAQDSRARAAIAGSGLRQATLSLLGVRAVGGSGEFDVLAPSGGRIVQRLARPGQALDAMAAAFTIATDDRLDLEFALPLELATRLQPGQQVLLAGGAVARVVAVGGGADPGAQSLRVRARIDGASDLLPGQQLGITLQLPAPPGAVAVPASALLQDGQGHRTYVRDGQAWRGVPVTRLGGDGGTVVVTGDGLRAGQTVATSGAGLLDAMAAGE